MFCNNCGTQNPEDGVFCVNCGQSLQAAAPPVYEAPAYEAAPAAPVDEAKDAEDNKFMGVLAYLGILWLVPFFTKKDSPFAMYHAKQGALLTIVWIAYAIVYSVLGAILRAIFPLKWTTGLVYTRGAFYGILSFVLWLGYAAIGVLAIIGIIAAVKGAKKPLPLIGNLNFLDKLFNK